MSPPPSEPSGMPRLRCFQAECEVWVKPLFRKSRPKIITSTWMVESYEQFLRLVRQHYEGKRWTFKTWSELEVRHISNPRLVSER